MKIGKSFSWQKSMIKPVLLLIQYLKLKPILVDVSGTERNQQTQTGYQNIIVLKLTNLN
jgi:hypothetical protein